MPELLLICQANICRSPLAEGVVKKLIQEGDFQEGWTTGSAGTWALEGRPAHPYTLALLKEAGIDLNGHRSREVTEKILAEADLVLTMEAGQAEALRAEFPEQAGKVYMLSELAGLRRDVEDPVGGTRGEFEQTAEVIEGYLRGSEAVMLEMMEGRRTGDGGREN